MRAMKNLGTEFRVGLFTLLAGITTGYIFLVLSPESFEKRGMTTYATVVEDASGVVKKTHVKTNGVIVGQVSDVILEVNQTRLILEIEDRVKIPKGSKVRIREKGLLGDVFIDVARVEDSGDYYQHGDEIPPVEGQMNLSSLMASAGDIAKDVKKVTSALANAMGSDKGREQLENIVEDIAAITGDVRRTVRVLGDGLAGEDKKLERMIGNLDGTLADIREFSGHIKGLVSGPNQERLENILASFNNTMEDAEVTAHNVRMVSAKLERGEGTIGRLLNDEKTVAEIEGAVKDIRKLLKPATQLKVKVNYHGELRHGGETQHYFDLHMKTRPDRYYLFGVTDLKEKTVDTTTQAGVTPEGEDIDGKTREIQTISIKEKLRFNLQYAKRYGPMQFRFGLFESTGGIATDFYAMRDRVRLTMEAFDWDSPETQRRTAHFKTYMTLLFYDHVYAMIGLDDFTRVDSATGKVNKSLKPLGGIGLSFDDDDLKGLMGTAALAL